MRPVLFFDGACPLCSREIAHYRRLDRAHGIRWVDITREEASVLEAFGIGRIAAMQRLHAIDEHGRVVIGVPAFIAVWRHLQAYRHLARCLERCGLVAILDRLYRVFAAWRYRNRCRGAVCSRFPGGGAACHRKTMQRNLTR